jgi:hypothetical protein
MLAMIEVYNDLGECVGRFDSKCYNVKDHGCSCICGGINHEIGLERAIENIRKNADALEDAHDHINIPGKRSVQLNLFDDSGIK